MFNKISILLFLFAASIAATSFAPTTYTYKTVGNLNIQLDVYTPPTSPPAGGYPVLFAIHGGAYIGGTKSSVLTGQEGTEAMKRGWVVVSINYRLMPGVILDDIIQDVQDAYSWVRTELIKKTPINPDLITIYGKSAGGGLAVLSGYKLTPRPKVVVGFYPGLTNWTDPMFYNPNTPLNPLLFVTTKMLSGPVLQEYNPSSPIDGRNVFWALALSCAKVGWFAVTHDPNLSTEKILAKLRDLSAVENVDKDYPPTYLTHGLVDTVVPYSQSVQMAEKLKEKNIPYELDLVANANHSFELDPKLWEKHVLPAFEFAAKYMQVSKKVTKVNSFLRA